MGSGKSPPAKRLEYLCACEPRGPNCACALAIRRAATGEGGAKRVVVRSSYLDFSPTAVDRQMVGRDKDAGLIPVA